MDIANALPPVTGCYAALVFATTVGISTDMITPYNVYFNRRLILQEFQLWRLFSSFFYFGPMNFDFVLHLYFLIRYSKTLEEGTFRGRSADYLWMLLLGALMLDGLASIWPIEFLQSAMTSYMVYVWSRRNPYVQLNFFGVTTFSAPYLPWVLLAFSLLVSGVWVSDLMGIAAGHVYFFMEDVYPRQGGPRLFKTPRFMHVLFDRLEELQGANAAARQAAARGGLMAGGLGMLGHDANDDMDDMGDIDFDDDGQPDRQR